MSRGIKLLDLNALFLKKKNLSDIQRHRRDNPLKGKLARPRDKDFKITFRDA